MMARQSRTTELPQSLWTRRRLVAATISGALLGSAGAIGFQEASGSNSAPSITVSRDRDALAAIIEFRGHRVLLLDGSTTEMLDELTELTAGFMRQRIDILLGTTPALAAIPVGFRTRWRITDILALPDSDRYPQISLDGRELQIENLTVSTDRHIHREWLASHPGTGYAWQVTVTYGRSRIIVASDRAMLDQLVPAAGAATVVICNDEEIARWPTHASTDILLAPPDVDIADRREPSSERKLIPFHQRFPMTFGLTTEGIELPSSY